MAIPASAAFIHLGMVWPIPAQEGKIIPRATIDKKPRSMKKQPYKATGYN